MTEPFDQEREAAPTAVPTPPPAAATPPALAWRAALPWLVAAALAAAALTTPAAWSASALPWLDGLQADPPPQAALLRPLVALAGAARAALALRALGTVATLLAALLLARRLLPPAWQGVAILALWLWPPSRTALTTIGGDAVLAAGVVTIAAAAAALEQAPRRAALAGGLALATVALAHPLGLALAPLLAVVLAMLPSGSGARWPLQGVQARSTWLAWLATLAVAVAALRLWLPAEALVAWWKASLAPWRGAQVPLAAAPDGWPWLGPWLALAARTTPWLVIALAAATWTAWRRSDAAAPLLGGWAAVTAVAALAGRPLPAPADLLVVGGPAAVLLAVWWLHQVSRRWPRPATAAATALAMAALALEGGGADGGGPALSLAGRALAPLQDADADLPAILDADALALIAASGGGLDVAPGRRDGNALLTALVRNGRTPQGARVCLVTSCGRPLLRQGGSGVVAQTWTALTEVEAARGAWELRRRRVPPQAAEPR